MQARLHVVDAVETIVQGEEIEDLAHEIPRVVVRVVLVATVVPKVVDLDDPPHCVEVRDEYEEQRLLPAETDERDLDGPNDDRLEHELAVPRLGSNLRPGGKLLVRSGDANRGERAEGQKVQEVPAEVHARRAHEILPLLR